MPATARQIERHYTEPPDDAPMVTCPECRGEGRMFVELSLSMEQCSVCNGSGYIDAERAAEDAAEDWGDQRMELARERATGFEE